MVIPNFKKISLTRLEKKDLINQLSSFEFGNSPILITISESNLKSQDDPTQMIQEVVNIVDQFIDNNDIPLSPYPICFETSSKTYSSNLLLVRSPKKTPRFFSQKVNKLNLKENILLNKVHLLQNKLRSINNGETDPLLQEFSLTQKKIRDLELMANFMNDILKGIK